MESGNNVLSINLTLADFGDYADHVLKKNAQSA